MDDTWHRQQQAKKHPTAKDQELVQERGNIFPKKKGNNFANRHKKMFLSAVEARAEQECRRIGQIVVNMIREQLAEGEDIHCILIALDDIARKGFKDSDDQWMPLNLDLVGTQLTENLSGAALDYAVAVAIGHKPKVVGSEVGIVDWNKPGTLVQGYRFQPSSDWEHCGPIIARHNICIGAEEVNLFWAEFGSWKCYSKTSMTEAAMRCFVRNMLGYSINFNEV